MKDQVAFIRDLRDVPCSDCGGRFPPYMMDFDHRDPATKSFEITRVAGRVSMARLLEAVASAISFVRTVIANVRIVSSLPSSPRE
jgi:hypothetical protein